MSDQNFNTFQQNTNDDIDLGKLIRYILMQSKMIFFITLVALFLGIAWYLSSTKLYKISSLLQVESFNQGSLDPTDTLEMISPLRASADLDSLIILYKSRTNLLKMINDLNLNIVIDDISDKEEVVIAFSENKSDEPYEVTFYILPNDNSVKIFSDKGTDLLIEESYDQEINIFDEFSFSIKSVNLEKNRLLKITYINPVLLYPFYKTAINLSANTATNSFMRDEGLIEIAFITDNIHQGKKIIDYSNKIFLDQRVLAETEKSRAAIKFIDENLLGLQKIVFQNKEKLKEFRETNKSINLDLETQVVIDTVKSIDDALYQIEVELEEASKTYTTNNPIYIGLVNKKKILTKQKENILSEIQFMPKEQQEYIDLFAQVEITQNLLEELETRRLGFSILEASTIGDIRIVDNAYMEEKVSPSLLSIIVFTFLAFIFSLIIAIIRGANYLPITNPAEIMGNGLYEPIMGVLPYVDNIDNEDILITDSRFKSSIESAIVNIRALEANDNNRANIISITSATQSNGKSTISKTIAQYLALLGKKVLLVDADFKRGSLGKDLNVRSISEKTFYDISPSNIEKYNVSENFYLIPRVKGLANSFHFICSPKYPKVIEDLNDHFDFIIFDTAPLLSVADTSVILNLSHVNLLVVRHEVNKIGEIKQTLDIYSQLNTTLDGYIYNAYSKPKGYYGYYGLYGNYSYSYYSEKYLNDSYEYKKED